MKEVVIVIITWELSKWVIKKIFDKIVNE